MKFAGIRESENPEITVRLPDNYPFEEYDERPCHDQEVFPEGVCPFWASAADYKVPGCMLYHCRYEKED